MYHPISPFSECRGIFGKRLKFFNKGIATPKANQSNVGVQLSRWASDLRNKTHARLFWYSADFDG